VLLSQSAGLVLVALALPVLPRATPSHADLWWGAIAGVAGGIAVALLYRALALGKMSIVAPITAVTAVTLPVLTSIALGERPGWLAVLGILLGIVSIVLVSRQAGSPSPEGSGGQGMRTGAKTGIGPALIAGIAMGIFLLALAQTRREAGLWPLLTDRFASLAFFGILMAIVRASPRLPLNVTTLALVGGSLDMVANALFLIAVRVGPFSPIVTLCALYPATTVLLARAVLGERLNAWQAAGVGCALAAVVLIVRG
jgi:drug/metabolite transporter (DMT)-like permease